MINYNSSKLPINSLQIVHQYIYMDIDLPGTPVWRRKNLPFIAQPLNRGGSEMPANNLK